MASRFLQDLLQRLYDALSPTWASGWRWRPRPSQDEYGRAVAASRDALDAIAATGDWKSIPSLLDVLAHDRDDVRSGAAMVIDRLMDAMPIGALPGFEVRVRASTLRAYAWHELQKSWVTEQQWPTRVWAIFSMHSNGFIREAALRVLVGDAPSAMALPYLLLRLNDWVAQVRSVAISAVRALLVPEHAAAWIPVLGLVDQLRARSRADHAWLYDEVALLFVRPELRSELMNAARSQERPIARWAFRTAMTLPEADRGTFVTIALESADPVLRLHGAKVVRTWSGCPGRTGLLVAMASDTFMPVRREALYAALDESPERRRAVLNAGLLDGHASMRHAARFYLREAGERSEAAFDARGFYLEALARGEPTELAAAVLGLGECGTPEDAEVLAGFVLQRRARVAAAAVKAVAALDRANRVEWLVGLLRDGRPSVAREAARVLETQANAVPLEVLRGLMCGDSHEHVRRYALRVLLRKQAYDALADAVNAFGSGDRVLMRAGVAFIEQVRSWKVSYGASELQKAAVISAMRRLRKPLPVNLRQRIRDFLGVDVP